MTELQNIARVVALMAATATFAGCTAPEGKPGPGEATRQAATSTGAAARDIAQATGIIASSTYNGVTGAASATQVQAEILAMPKIQDGWIEPSAATQAAATGAVWNFEGQHVWNVRLANGKTYSITQSGAPMQVGQKVMVIRYAGKLAIAD